MPNRRDFLKSGALVGAGAVLASGIGKTATAQQLGKGPIDNSYTIYAAGTPPLTKWTEQLVSAIPTATPMVGGNPLYPGADYYELVMEGGPPLASTGQRWTFHSLLPVTSPKKFTTWQYRDNLPGGWAGIGYLGPTIEAKRNVPVVVKFINNLPDFHPVQQGLDPTIPEVEIYGVMPGGRATPHLHGGYIAPQFDGHPFSWWTKKGEHGTHYATLGVSGGFGQLLPNNEAVYYYCNQQPAAMLWYHDHAMGVTRVNAYVGLAALYFIRDQYDTGKPFDAVTNPLPALNLPAGSYEVPLVLQDKTFNIDGSLFYPILGVTPDHPIWMPEFFGDTPVINGKCYPNFNVEPRRYRFRIVNGSQARFYHFWFKRMDTGAKIPVYQIGAEQGLLPSPYLVPGGAPLIAPGERLDIIVDFAGIPVGTTILMKNDANAPYPGGGGGPKIPELMQLTVVGLNGVDLTTPAAQLSLGQTFTPLQVPLTPVMREIAMIETLGASMQGNQMAPTHVRLNERWFDDPADPAIPEGPVIIEETPEIGATEVWQYINTTADEHPMHSHLVAFQVQNRQAFNAAAYMAAYVAWAKPPAPAVPRSGPKPVLAQFLVGASVAPLPDEAGFKDTVRCPSGFVTRVAAKYDLPDYAVQPPIPGAGVSTLPAKYVYHCHILEHEENEMMRPFAVTAPGGGVIINEPRSFYKPGARDVASVPTEFGLEQNYPNPFNPVTTFRFTLPVDSRVELKIYNGIGQDVATVVDANYVAGTHTANWKAGNLASGPYFAKLTAGEFSTTKKVILVK